MQEISEGFTFSDYWQIFIKNKIIAVIAFFLVIISVYIFTNTVTPQYQASTTVELRYETPNMMAFGGYFPAMFTIINRDTEIRKITSYPLMELVARELGYIDDSTSEEDKNSQVSRLRSKISVSQVGETTLIKIDAIDSDPDNAIGLANTVGDVYVKKTIEERNDRAKKSREFIEEQLSLVAQQLKEGEESARQYKQTGKITDRISEFGAKLSELSLQRQRLLTKFGDQHPDIISLEKQISNLKNSMSNLTSGELGYINLMREITINEELYMIFNKKLKEALIAEADKVIPVAIVDPARRAALIKPNRHLNMMMSVLLGLILAVISVFVRENLDTALKTAHDVESYLKVTALTEIPHMRPKKEGVNLPYLLIKDRSSAYLEAFNNLTASVISFGPSRKLQTFLFTSMMPREGKSEIVANFGIVESQRGNKTLIIDADFRQPIIHSLFGISRKPGIIDAITENMDWKKVIQSALSEGDMRKKIDIDVRMDLNLSILSAGHLPPNPMRFLSSKEFRNIIDKAKEIYDVIILDSPPLYYFADPTVLSSVVDGIIMVHKPGSIGRNELFRTIQQLKSGDGKLLGIVLNDVTGKVRGKYYYRYYSRKPNT
ncbi:MAG: polysaccharide biosynthesis tyrosine autokinase [Elusimicrobia bacterium]|nr:polysaccharide biosynthesis tyrosine autokinase [Elusimicrobiota bacterium]